MLQLWLNEMLIAPAAPAPTISEWQAVEFCALPPADATLTLTLRNGAQQHTPAPFLRPGEAVWRWHWNPQQGVGRYTVQLDAHHADGSSMQLAGTFTVAPARLDAAQYAALLADVQQVAHTLAYALAHSAAGAQPAAQADAAQEPGAVLAALLAWYTQQTDTLERAVREIARRPQPTQHSHSEQVPLEQARGDMAQAAASVRNPGDLVVLPEGGPLAGQTLPATVPQRSSRPQYDTYDTYEHRVLKRLLHVLTRRVQLIAAASAQAAPAQADQCRALQARLSRLCSLPLLAQVGPLSQFRGASQVFRRHPAYRVVYRCWQALHQQPALRVESALWQLPIHDLPRLYEYWCVLQVVQAALHLPDVQVVAQQLVRLHAADAETGLLYRLGLREDAPLLVLRQGQHTLRLRYQPRYRPTAATATEAADVLVSLDRHTHIPDLALEWHAPDSAPRLLLCDAKYRLDASGTLPAAALADGYTYLGSIGLAAGTRAAQQVALLYPGQRAAEHYASGISLLPLLPGRPDQEQALSGLMAGLMLSDGG
jgi:large subunit ribosomal protein MRP49